MNKVRPMLIIVLSVLLSGAFQCFAEELIPFEEKGKYGYVNRELSVVLQPQWDYATYFRHGETAIVGMEQNDGTVLRGIIDTDGRYLVPCEYDILAGESESFFGGEDGYYFIMDRITGLCGYYDIKNRYFCEPQYADVDIWYRNDEDIISVGDPQTGFCGYVHALTGEAIGEFMYIETGPWCNGAAIAEGLDGQWIQFADGARRAVPEGYNAEHRISHGLFTVVNHESKYGLMNLKGEIVTSKWYDGIYLDSIGDFYGEYMGRTELVCYRVE